MPFCMYVTAMSISITTTTSNIEARELLRVVHDIARTIAAEHAAEVDANARFPAETVAALRAAKVLSAAVPKQLGGAGCNLSELAVLCSSLAQACGSSAMVLAMHFIQVACIVRHGSASVSLSNYLRELLAHQYLLASMTSEVGTFGDTRSSLCVIERSGERFNLNKDATTGSYCAQADGILVTCRRAADAPHNDQVLVLLRSGDFSLCQTTAWDTLGMRGTCSPGFKLASSGETWQIIPAAFADIAAQTMVPYSHVLWSSLWWGIAADAVARASAFVRGEARKKPGTVPALAARLAAVSAQLQAMKHHWLGVAHEFDELSKQPTGMQELLGIGWALKLNNLKINASELAPQIVHKALQIVGILGYKNDSKLSLGRHYRDVLSASLMISNERIAASSALMLLVFKDS
jgi:acyl-CoA dehydrogenase